MKRSETPLLALGRATPRRRCRCGPIFTLLLGMSPGMLRAGVLDRPIRTPHRLPGPSQAPQVARSPGRFHFDDLRVQALNEEGAPALSRVRSGQRFHITS